MGTIKFPNQMPAAPIIGANDKLMIARGDTGEAYQATWDKAKEYLNISGIELQPVPEGSLPSGPSGQERKMQVGSGTWTYGGNTFTVPEGSTGTLWWNGITWSLAQTMELPMQEGVDVINPDGNQLPKEKAAYRSDIETAIKVMNLDTDSLTLLTYIPEDKSSMSFDQDEGASGVYFENVNHKGFNKFFVKAAISGTAQIVALTRSVNEATILYTKTVSLIVGVNEFTAEDLEIPQTVLDLDVYYLGLNPSVSGQTKYNTSTGGTLSVFDLVGYDIADTDFKGSTWFVTDGGVGDTILGKYPATKQLIESTVNMESTLMEVIVPYDRNGIDMIIAGSELAVYGEEEIYVSNTRPLSKLNIYAQSSGQCHVYFVEISSGIATVKHTKTVSCVLGKNSFTANQLDAESIINGNVENLYILCGNTFNSDPNVIHGDANNPTTHSWFSLIRSTGVLSTYDSTQRFSFWIEVFLSENKLVDEVKRIANIVDNSPPSDISLYDYTENFPILPSDIFLDEQSTTSLYKNSLFSKFVGHLLPSVILQSNNKVIDIQEPSNLNHDDLGSSARIVVNKQLQPGNIIYKDVIIHKFDSTTKSGTLNWMSFGDSLTEGGAGFNSSPIYLLTELLSAKGVTVQGIGTLERTNGSITQRYEGRGGWRYRTFVGLESQFAGIDVLIPSPTKNVWIEGVDGDITTIKSNNPFLYEATAQDKIDYPQWCFHFVSGSTTNNVTYAQNPSLGIYHIFDPSRYFSERGITIPDVISIALGTNEWYLGGYSGWDIDLISSCADWMITRFLEAVPTTTKILVIPCNNMPLTRETEWQTKASVLTSSVLKIVEAKKLTHSNLFSLSIFAHGSRQLAYNYLTGVTDLNAYNTVKVGEIDSDVHILNVDDQGRFDYVKSLQDALLFLTD